EEVATFLESLFAAVDPYAPSAERLDTLRVRELLARGATRLRSELSDQPDVRAQMLDVVGRVYRSLGLYAEARPLLEEALATREGEGAPDLSVASTLTHLGILYTETGQLREAEDLLRQALEINRSLLP